MTHTGEVGIEIAPIAGDAAQADKLDSVLRRTCTLARMLTGAEQAALKLWLGEDPSQARKYFSLSPKYSAYADFRFDPKGLGLHGMNIPPGEVMCLTQDEVLAHPQFKNFSGFADTHPPMRGWLALSVCGDGGHVYGLLQLSDKADGSDFDEHDVDAVRELSSLIGELLDALEPA
jgi:hypothetical protein